MIPPDCLQGENTHTLHKRVQTNRDWEKRATREECRCEQVGVVFFFFSDSWQESEAGWRESESARQGCMRGNRRERMKGNEWKWGGKKRNRLFPHWKARAQSGLNILKTISGTLKITCLSAQWEPWVGVWPGWCVGRSQFWMGFRSCN